MTNPKGADFTLQSYDENPFDGFKIDDNTILNKLEGRQPCPNCGKSRKFFCYTCYVPISPLNGKLPHVKLPLKIDIIKHKYEIDGKSTASHAALLARDDIKVYTYPDIPDYSNENVVLIFPGQKAISVSQLVNGGSFEKILEYQRQPLDELPAGYNRSTLMKNIPKTREETNVKCIVKQLPITKAVFIDSTWHQCKSIYKDERIKSIPCVVIQNRISQFWRHQKGSPRWYLATVEAIHQFLFEIHLHCWGLHQEYKGIKNCFTEKGLEQLESCYSRNENAYNGQYDNLLFFFKHMYDVIHTYYKHEDLYAYKRRLK
ncbi:DTW domain-containing protein 1 [Sitophilus oryzae]|uniref:tRNA-uridine aminocarboxypropyltransferase 1 n=1 Tax=Sitophilus oryzae TaxID=7048 RepID=A0A6J2Y1F5_SITOR|nr:DTW domain-containing protein 1 [Sitophilus oryzae]XP_030757613.1 DTW domain-containing protein 1 [Sitophilus oryzae]